ncbi:DUF6636 domain-containing protein [Nocardia sp. NPDC059177]|uniref:DUF6636 domain-containing protein n=1 Tax=Nocardia sp. NPDC059177 TaxID=3346759 RepID=UPI0036C6C97C
MRAVIVVAALVALAGGVAACDTTEPAPAVTESTSPTAPKIVTSPVTADPTVVPDTSPVTADPTVVPDTSPVPTGMPTRDDATVDARAYQQRDNYYFQSPTGNIMCGILADAPFGFGCQLSHANVIPPQLPNCDDAPNRKVAVHVDGNTTEFLCTSQGIFIGAPVDGTNKGGGATLHYGDTLVVRGVACTSTEQGIRCDAAGHGFTISADQQTLY